MKLRTLLPVMAAMALVATGCSEETPGAPGTTPEVPTPGLPSSQTPGGESNAPTVANPVQNVDKFMNAPCDMLSKDQAAEIGYDASVEPETDDSQGPGCEWQNGNDEDFSITLLKNQPLGIAGIYRNHEQFPDADAYFEPVDIAGFPGVFGDRIDARPDGSCGLTVGITDQQVITIINFVKADPCDVVKRAAEAAVETMSKG